MAENPPLNRIYVLGYSANDRDYPIVSLNADPRVAGYRIPEDLSTCPDKRYPNHVFTGAQPLSGDERVRHVWEILPSPWVPFTRYDDDLGPVQGRRRSVKNEGQVASREADKQVTYEAREGSAIVYTELEETWSIKTDEDGNSLFPIRDRDFYDPSRGPIQERRQIFVPTGEEAGSLENVNGVITQTSYEPYNDFLSVKIVQTYKVDGPQLIGKATDNEGQLVTITTQRKAADGYVPTSPTATRTVEASREDAESLVERIVDTPQVFGAEVYRKTREDITPQKFKAAQKDTTAEQNVEGTANPSIALATGEFAKSEQQISKFVKRISTTTRDIDEAVTLVEKVLTNEGQIGTRTLNLQAGDQSLTPSATTVDGSVEALGDGRTVKSETIVPNVFSGQSVVKTKVDLTPEKFRAAQQDTTTEESVEGAVNTAVSLGAGEFRKSEQQVTEFVKRVSSTTRDISSATDLSEVVVTPQGQVATRTLRLSAQTQSIQPDALLVDGSIEALGDGRTVKTEVRVSNVFANKSIQKTKADLTPQKFRAAQEDTITEETVAGTINPNIILSAGEFNKSEQQVTEFTKRTSTNTRNVESATELTETVVTPQGQVATRTLILSAQEQSIQPDALLVDGSIEALGDGRTIKTEVKVPNVFPQTLLRIEKPVTIPERFLVNNPTTTEAETIEDASPSVELTGDAISQQAERTGEFTARKTTTERSLSASGPLSGADYDELSNSQIPFTESISSSVPSGPCEADPLGGGRILVKQYNLSGIESNLGSVMLSFPTRSSIAGIPPVLKNLDVVFEKSKGKSDSDTTGTGTGTGNSGSISASGRSDAKATASVIPKFIIELEEVNAANVPTTSFFFFLKYPVTLSAILARVGAQQWPVFKPKSYTLMATGQSVTGSLDTTFQAQRSWASESSAYSQTNGNGYSEETTNQIITVSIPPCIHGGFTKNITEKEETEISVQININLSGGTGASPLPIAGTPISKPVKAESKVAYSLAATSVESVPTSGTYLINSNVQPYKFGFAKVYAEVVNASIFA